MVAYSAWVRAAGMCQAGLEVAMKNSGETDDGNDDNSADGDSSRMNSRSSNRKRKSITREVAGNDAAKE